MASTANVPSNATLITAPQPSTSSSSLYGGPSSTRPSQPLLGQLYYDTTVGAEIVWNGTIWSLVSPQQSPAVSYGPTSSRPLSPYNGQPYYNTSLGGLECWNGSVWVLIGPSATAGSAVPIIVTQPAGQTVNPSASVTFTVAATGVGSLSYQWYWNGVSIGGATSNSYNIATVAQSNGGGYYVVVTNAGGSVQSQTATLVVTGAPYIVVQPTSQTVASGNNVAFSVIATGTNPLSYQWYYSSAPITGATSSSYAIPNVSSASAGSYYCVVTNSISSATTSTVTLTVNAPLATFSCTSFNATSVTTNGYPATVGCEYVNTGSITVVLAGVQGALPAGISLTGYDANGNVLASVTSTGSQSSINVVVSPAANSSSNTFIASTQIGTPIPVLFTVTASGAMLFTNGSVRGTIYGVVIFPPSGYGLTLNTTSITPGSMATCALFQGTNTTYLTPPYFGWNFNGDTTSNPKTNFNPGTSLSLSATAGSSTVNDSRLEFDSP